MRILLAGYNIDTEIMEEAIKRGLDPNLITPETISAAYARISRYPDAVDKLRRKARSDVARARASNSTIIFELGHSSIAEHAMFNFDIIDISRLAIESLEHFRLCSYTEKSQRYIQLKNDFLLPTEIAELGLADDFHRLVEMQNRTYHSIYERIKEYLISRHAVCVEDRSQMRLIEERAKEDARYVTPLATFGQLGMTINARNLELMIRRLAAHPLQEVNFLANALLQQAKPVAPSLLRYTTPPTKECDLIPEEIKQLTQELRLQEAFHTQPGSMGAVQLVDPPADGDITTVAALLHTMSPIPWNTCYQKASMMSLPEQAKIIRAALRNLQVHDNPPRAFELVSLRFDVILSASAFAQLKRHRMATLLAQPYSSSLSYTMPETIVEAGMKKEFQQVMAESIKLFELIKAKCPDAAPYALTQAHRRRVLLQMNAREIYHFSRLRQDRHAQWDIRQIADRMLNLAREVLPLTLELACGKDAFSEKYQQVMSTSDQHSTRI